MQLSIFNYKNQYKILKPIRLIELFGGYGSQHFALEYLGAEFEQWKLCEWATKSIQAYKDAHCADDDTDYSAGMAKDEVMDWLFKKGISADYNKPMTYEQVKRLGEGKARKIYNNIKATHNLVNIQQVRGCDLEIVDTDKYEYVLTYSFPCQDLSLAGKQMGMSKDVGTRSGMLWEVERILNECEQLPQILVMENIPQVHGTKNREDFESWIKSLERLGYSNYWKDLNAKNFGVPQNRNRCFMVSILGDWNYEFPSGIELKLRLKDLLEDEVDEKYYLSDRAINGCINSNFNSGSLEARTEKNGIILTLLARDFKDPKLVIEIKGKEYPITKNNNNFREGSTRCQESNYICKELPENYNIKCLGIYEYTASDKFLNGKDRFIPTDVSPTMLTNHNYGVVVSTNNKRIKTCAKKLNPTIDGQFMDIFNQKNREDGLSGSLLAGMDAHQGNIVYNNYRIRKLTPKECFRLMGVKDEDFEKIALNQSNASLYHLAGDSIVVDVLMAIFKNLIQE